MSEVIGIVSPHAKGFWQVDIYLNGWDEDATPDWFCTGTIGDNKECVVNRAKEHYPDAEIVDGETGFCLDCGKSHFLLEEECNECGGMIGED